MTQRWTAGHLWPLWLVMKEGSVWAASLSLPSKAEWGMWWGWDLAQAQTLPSRDSSSQGKAVDQKMG